MAARRYVLARHRNSGGFVVHSPDWQAVWGIVWLQGSWRAQRTGDANAEQFPTRDEAIEHVVAAYELAS
jgi:hypothetical protein